MKVFSPLRANGRWMALPGIEERGFRRKYWRFQTLLSCTKFLLHPGLGGVEERQMHVNVSFQS